MTEHPGFGEPMTAIKHPADGTLSPPVHGEFRWELCNGTLVAESYIREGSTEHRVRLTNRLVGADLSLRWEQWEDLKEAIEEGPALVSNIARDAEVLHSEHHPGTFVPTLDSCPEHDRADYEDRVRRMGLTSQPG